MPGWSPATFSGSCRSTLRSRRAVSKRPGSRRSAASFQSRARRSSLGEFMRIAYLVSQYPAASHTFIRREVMGLRARGYQVHTFSVRPPTAPSKLAEIDQKETADTWYVLPAAPARLARAHAKALLARPV